MKQRPVNLNFLTLHFPLTAWVSIAHRLSGLLVFLMIPALLWMLQESLASEDRLLMLKVLLHNPMVRVGLWILLAALLYHWVAGIRHLCLDIHIGESKKGGFMGAALVIVISLIFVGFLGYGLW